MSSIDTITRVRRPDGREVWERLPAGTKAPRGARYRVRYRTPDGASRTQTFDRKIDAEQFITSTEHRKLAGQYVDQSAGRTTFGDVARRWADAQPHRDSTAASVEMILRKHIEPTFGHRPIAGIRTSEVQAWVSGLALAPSTVAVVYGKLAAIFNAAVDDRLIASSPCTRKIRLPRPEGAEVTPMTPEQVRVMVEAVGERYGALVVLMAGTGLRPGEAVGLTYDRVDFLRRTIRVDRQLATMPKVAAVLAPVKTTSSVRTIPVPDSVLTALAAHRERHSPGPFGLIFTDSKGDPIRRSALGHIWRRAAVKVNARELKAKRAALIVDRTPHDLRHYAASVMIHQGASVKAVQRHLGHASATTTLDTYAHLWPDTEDVTRRALETGVGPVVSAVCYTDAVGE